MSMDITKRESVVGLVGWLALSYAASALGAIATVQARSFYSELTQPAWAPPGWLFGPVWTVLFALMGVAAWLVWLRGGFFQQRAALLLFVTQLAFNALWSWLFFAWRLGLPALLEILMMWGLILATLLVFWRVRHLAGLLLVPYLLWVSFAAALNYSLWQLNPGLLS